MRKKLVLVIFILAVAGLALLFVGRGYYSQSAKTELTTARLVIPQGNGSEETENDGETTTSIINDDIILTSLIPMQGDETLINIVSADFNGDGYEDQMNAIKTTTSPYLQLLLGLYNPKNETYERSALIATKVSQVKTFSYYGIDLTGRNKIALVYQGFTQTGTSVLQAMHFEVDEKDGTVNYYKIADIESDGAIYLQQKESPSAYSVSPGYSIMVYSTDREDAGGSDQIQTQWDWSNSEKHFVISKRNKIKGSYIAARELAKIQDGTVKTFADHLSGLWYKTDSKAKDLRYVLFDYDSRQIVFLMDDEEEVYNWENSSLHYRGIYISTTNFEIVNLQRKVNISLTDLDRINIIVNDDVSMAIKEESLWNGEYKKMKFSDFYSDSTTAPVEISSYVENLEKGPFWTTSDGKQIYFAAGKYTATSGEEEYTGFYIPLMLNNEIFLQMRSSSKESLFDGTYQIGYSPSIEDETKMDEDRIILQPYKIMINNSYSTDDRPFILSRGKSSD